MAYDHFGQLIRHVVHAPDLLWEVLGGQLGVRIRALGTRHFLCYQQHVGGIDGKTTGRPGDCVGVGDVLVVVVVRAPLGNHETGRDRVVRVGENVLGLLVALVF
jgi:hypothetical protein